jgi:hypothetical protein
MTTNSIVSVTFVPSTEVATGRYFELTSQMSEEYNAGTLGMLIECPSSGDIEIGIAKYPDILVARCAKAAKKYNHSKMVCVVLKKTYERMRAHFPDEIFISENASWQFMPKIRSIHLVRYEPGPIIEEKDQIIVTAAA